MQEFLGFTLSQLPYFLTEREFSKKLRSMDGDVTSLESKLDQFLAHFAELREENRALRERVAGLEGEKNSLTDKIQTARVRLEALMDRLPEQ
jgi:cell division protein ZapB